MGPAIGGDISQVPPWDRSGTENERELGEGPLDFMCVYCGP